MTAPRNGGSSIMQESGGSEAEQLRRLRRSRALATGLLAVAAAVFAATLAVPHPAAAAAWLPPLRAVAEAALVGGLADWFAVVALFRRPLGLPIPHTAILPANKDRIGEGLARFLERHFLTPELLLPEIRSLHVADRIAAWLAQRRNATALASEIGRGLPLLLRAVDDRQITAFLGRALGAQFGNAQIAALLGRLVRILTSAGYHEAVLDSALEYGRAFLTANEARLLESVEERRRRWVPRVINREIARAMLRAAATLIDDLRRPGGAARKALLASLDGLASRLEAGELGLDRPILGRPEVQAWIAASWQSGRDIVLRDLDQPSSRTRRALAAMIASVGDALKADPAMRERLDATVESLAIEALPWRSELSRFVTEVVGRWEPRGFSDRIEAAVGADLQYIRMNGTIVGGLVGGLLYALSLLAR